ncbi:MAG: quinone-dependent dihydroorotate dehydrogenase [Myxococcales bacterium]|jgi:dihydroorotate dehydrogenase
MLYRLLRPLLYLLPAETAHRLVMGAMALLSRLPFGPGLLRALYGAPDPSLRVEALGLSLPSPLGLAAGLDKDAEAYEAFGALGFGFVEVGTITAQAQPGNPRPRLFRLVRDRALINRMGFNNHGAEAARRRLQGRSRGTVVGVNLGKTKVVPAERAVEDYVQSARLLGPLADYVVINVSSPNTPGLRDLQAVEHLRPLLGAVREALDGAVAERRVALLVKIAPDLADADVDAVADLSLELGLDGIIATNTTIAREGLATPSEEVERCGAGGLSGAPLKQRSLEVLRRLRARVGERLVLISVGGIETADEARERLQAGATLVQLYTALIYGGPSLPGRINRGLVRGG